MESNGRRLERGTTKRRGISLSEHPSIQKSNVANEHPSLTADAPNVEAQAEQVVKEIQQPDISRRVTGALA